MKILVTGGAGFIGSHTVVELQNEGFDPQKIKDPLYFFEPVKEKYIKLTPKVYSDIQKGNYRF